MFSYKMVIHQKLEKSFYWIVLCTFLYLSVCFYLTQLQLNPKFGNILVKKTFYLVKKLKLNVKLLSGPAQQQQPSNFQGIRSQMLPQQQQQQQQTRPIMAANQSLHMQRMPNPRMPLQQQQVRLNSVLISFQTGFYKQCLFSIVSTDIIKAISVMLSFELTF